MFEHSAAGAATRMPVGSIALARQGISTEKGFLPPEPEVAATRKVSIMLTSCGYEQAMSALMLANASAMTGKEVHLFATFRGVRVVRRGFRPRFPGLLAPLTPFFEGRLRKQGIGTFAEQLGQARELGVHLYACDLCVRIGLLKKERLVEGIEVIGMPRFAEIAGESHEHFAF